MRISICDRKGITLVEVLVSVVLITIGILALLTLLPSGWRLSGTSDNLGRAAGILQAVLERNEIMIMNGNNQITPGTLPPKYFDRSGKEMQTQTTDTFYTAATVIQNSGTSFRVRVTLSWPGNSTGIAESVIVGRQMAFAQ